MTGVKFLHHLVPPRHITCQSAPVPHGAYSTRFNRLCNHCADTSQQTVPRWPIDCPWLCAPQYVLPKLTNIDESPVVLEPLEGAALGHLLLLCLCHLGRLRAHLAGASQRPVHLACTTITQSKVVSRGAACPNQTVRPQNDICVAARSRRQKHPVAVSPAHSRGVKSLGWSKHGLLLHVATPSFHNIVSTPMMCSGLYGYPMAVADAVKLTKAREDGPRATNIHTRNLL